MGKICGTRPWLIYDRGPISAAGERFKEDYTYFTRDIRFTTKGKTLYAFALGWPENGKITIRALGKVSGQKTNMIKRVELLGHKGQLHFSQDSNGLVINLPATKVSDVAIALKIDGTHLEPSSTGSGIK